VPDTTSQQEALLDFWFGDDADDAATAERQAPLWWKKNPELDERCRALFLPQVEAAAAGGLPDWAATARGRLALILLTDQLPRNLYRGSARAFASDPLAQRYCLERLDSGADRSLRPVERVFFYLPLEHAESLALQERSVALFGALAEAVPAAARKWFDGYRDYALRHRDIVARFGRFPHRNAALGRATTAEEADFLRTPGSSF
jgi:uncharacterized protein (DUF924 family)